MTSLNPLYDPSTDNAFIPDETQRRLNAPLTGLQLSLEESEFLQNILNLVEQKTIDLHRPSSILNDAVYTNLSEEAKGLADQNAVLMLARVRDIVDLQRVHPEPSYQMKNLLDTLIATKNRLEAHEDLFIL